ncbi:UNVERIFIED_ORG: hypothetical protein GGI63_005946 [Rhizobium esperanzae]|nr:hypothetical protein RHECNPAF_2270017 [Rhizobium etli CNPAF512]
MHFDTSFCGWLLPRHVNWLLACGVPWDAIIKREPIRLSHRFCSSDGFFEPEDGGPAWFVFAEREDAIFWRPETDELARWTGRSFALGEQAVDAAGTCSFGHSLNIYTNPLRWLKAGRDGIVVADWRRAFDRLRQVPRIAVEEELLPVYMENMKPDRMPSLFVLRQVEGAS